MYITPLLFFPAACRNSPKPTDTRSAVEAARDMDQFIEVGEWGNAYTAMERTFDGIRPGIPFHERQEIFEHLQSAQRRAAAQQKIDETCWKEVATVMIGGVFTPAGDMSRALPGFNSKLSECGWATENPTCEWKLAFAPPTR